MIKIKSVELKWRIFLNTELLDSVNAIIYYPKTDNSQICGNALRSNILSISSKLSKEEQQIQINAITYFLTLSTSSLLWSILCFMCCLFYNSC